MQNKMHFAATGLTAAEIVRRRADAAKPNMGLTSWSGGRVLKRDVVAAKSYLDEGEIDTLNRITVMFLDHAEFRAQRRKDINMADWSTVLDKFLADNELPVLAGAGGVSREEALDWARRSTSLSPTGAASRPRRRAPSATLTISPPRRSCSKASAIRPNRSPAALDARRRERDLRCTGARSLRGTQRATVGALTAAPDLRQVDVTAAPTPNPDGSTPAGSLDRGKGESTPPVGSSCVPSAVWPRAGAVVTRSRNEAMTTKKDFKSIVRDRQRKTGESYTAALAHVKRERARVLGVPEESSTTTTTAAPTRVEAAVLKVGHNSTARIRVLGEQEQITLRSRDVWRLAPGQIITLRVEKRWTFRGDAYASGKIESAIIDIARLGVEPLPLSGGELEDLREHYENIRAPDPYAPIWLANTAKPRACYEMHEITWGAAPDDDPFEGTATDEAVELAQAGDRIGAHEVLMNALVRDLRFLDAHAHLGNLEFDRNPKQALVHYEIGMRIGESFLPDGFEGVLLWGSLYNRPYLRCLHGYGLCLWRLGRLDVAIAVFERILALNPNDNQGARFCLFDVRAGLSWEEMRDRDEREEARRRRAAQRARTRPRRSDDPHVN
jgi:tetratricopeptide (TPR) repeat protein